MSKRCCAKMCYNSQLTNKNVSYFSFPKNEGYATAWAIAADRLDLLDKSLNNLIKYFICSEHFTDDCFLDPPHNARLKKTSRPVSAPIPTIFHNNILTQNLHNVITTNANTIADTDLSHIEEVDEPHPAGRDTSTTSAVGEKYSDLVKSSVSDKKQLTEETLPVLDKCNESNASINPLIFDVTVEDIQSTKNDVSLSDIESFYDTGVRSENALNNSDDIPFSCLQQSNGDVNSLAIDKKLANDYHDVCRLCAQVFHDSGESIHLFNDESNDDYEDLAISYIEQLLPNMISADDGLPQKICTKCFERLETCVNTLKSFKGAQELLQQRL